MLTLKILGIWFLISIPASLIIGRFIASGHDEDCQCDRHNPSLSGFRTIGRPKTIDLRAKLSSDKLA